MTQRHPRDTPSSNPHGTAAPTRHAQQQSPWHSATHVTRPPAISMAQRHPRDAPETQIPTPQRHPRDLPSSNPHGTAPHTRRARDADPHGTAPPTRPAQQQSPWHSATHATHATRPRRRSPRHSATPHDLPSSNPHGTAPPTPHTRRTRDADPHGTELTTHCDATATRPSGHTANEANTGPASRSLGYKREPFTTHWGKIGYYNIFWFKITNIYFNCRFSNFISDDSTKFWRYFVIFLISRLLEID